MEMKLKLAFHIGTMDQKTVELNKEEAKELYDLLHEMFGEKTKIEYVPYDYPREWPWINQPIWTSGYAQTTTIDDTEWHSKNSGITASFMENL